MLRRTLPFLTALIALLVLAGPATPAHAAKDQVMTFEAPRDLLDPAKRPGALADMESLGVKAVRIVMFWSKVAPSPSSSRKPDFDTTNPDAYAWGEYDAALQAARERGWKVLLTVSGPVPKWATDKRKDNLTRPDPAEFAQFMEAVGRKYGDLVWQWSIWNEPNQPQFLKPQYVNGKPESPRLYRALYKGALKGLAAAGSTKPVLIGETSPTGTRKVVAPLVFLRETLCLNSAGTKKRKSCGRLDTDGYAHHAYTRRTGPYYVPGNRNDVTISVLPRLVSALDKAAKAGAIPSRLKLYLTEFGIQSTPDPLYGVPFQQQAEYRTLSERIAYYNGRVASFSQYLLTDDDPRPGTSSIARYSGFESGLRTAAGKNKPAFDGFRLALAAKGTGARTTLWGLVRPAGGRTTAEVWYRNSARGSFKKLTTVTTDARGYFTKRVSHPDGRQFRLVWTAPDGTTYRGTPTRAYK